MSRSDDVIALFDGLDTLSPAGYAIGLHLSFTTSKYIFQSYSKEWMEEYSRKGFVLNDPTIRWGLTNEGWIAWSALKESDPLGVITSAEAFGLTHGASISVVDETSRSLGSFARTEAPFEGGVIDVLTTRLHSMHELTLDVEADSADDKRIKRFAASLSGIGLHDL